VGSGSYVEPRYSRLGTKSRFTKIKVIKLNDSVIDLMTYSFFYSPIKAILLRISYCCINMKMLGPNALSVFKLLIAYEAIDKAVSELDAFLRIF